MTINLSEDVKRYIDNYIARELEKYGKIYSREELLTKSEFLQALKIIENRFEAIDKRFEAVDKRFEELIDSMNRKFEAIDKRFEELINEIKILKIAVGTLGGREGKDFEKTILNILKKSIENRFIDLQKIEKKRIRDKEGEIVLPGQKVEVDIFASDGRYVIIEIKFHMTKDKIISFYKKAKIVEKELGIEAEKLVIAIEIDDIALDLAEDLGIEVITKS